MTRLIILTIISAGIILLLETIWWISVPIAVLRSFSSLIKAFTSKLLNPCFLWSYSVISFRSSLLLAPGLIWIIVGSIWTFISYIVFSKLWSVLTSTQAVLPFKKGTNVFAYLWYSLIFWDKIPEETYPFAVWPMLFILSWQISWGQLRTKTLDGALQFLMKNFAWKSFYGKLSSITLAEISLDRALIKAIVTSSSLLPLRPLVWTNVLKLIKFMLVLSAMFYPTWVFPAAFGPITNIVYGIMAFLMLLYTSATSPEASIVLSLPKFW